MSIKPRRKPGTQKLLADGRIRVTVSHGYRRDGRQRRLTGYASDEAEAERLAMELAAKLGRNPELGNGITLERWWQAYQATRGQRIANATLERYAVEMNNIWISMLGAKDITLITHADIQAVVLKADTRSKAHERIKALSAVLTHAVREGKLESNPCRSAAFELPGDVGKAAGKKTFSIDFDDIGWLEGLEEDPGDYCAHGHAVAHIGDETFEYYATLSATALYLLKSLTEDHQAYREEQFLPCCGFNIFEKGDDSGDVVILGCPNGIDWDLARSGDKVIITTDSGTITTVPYAEYREEVIRFADKVEKFYDSQPPRKPCDDDAAAYKAFWREWHRRRQEA